MNRAFDQDPDHDTGERDRRAFTGETTGKQQLASGNSRCGVHGNAKH